MFRRLILGAYCMVIRGIPVHNEGMGHDAMCIPHTPGGVAFQILQLSHVKVTVFLVHHTIVSPRKVLRVPVRNCGLPLRNVAMTSPVTRAEA